MLNNLGMVIDEIYLMSCATVGNGAYNYNILAWKVFVIMLTNKAGYKILHCV